MCGGCLEEGCEHSTECERKIEENEYENARNFFEIFQTFDLVIDTRSERLSELSSNDGEF